MRWRVSVLIALLAVSLLASVPYPRQQGKGSPPPLGSNLTVTVNPDRSVNLATSFYQKPTNFTKNTQQMHNIDIYENNSTGTETDSFKAEAPLPFIGVRSWVNWISLCCSNSYNHTVFVNGPENFALLVWPNGTYSSKTHQFNIVGNYTFHTQITNTTAPYIPSPTGHIYVINAEENQPPTTNASISLSKASSYVLLAENVTSTLTTWMKDTMPFPLNATQSFSLSGSSSGYQNTGNLTLHFVPGVMLPLSDLTLQYTSNSTNTTLTGNVVFLFNPSFPTPLENSTIFGLFYNATIGNATWVDANIVPQVNSTTGGKIQVSTFTTTATYNGNVSVKVALNIALRGDLPRFLTAMVPTSTGLTSKIYNETAPWTTSSSYVISYSKATATISLIASSHLVLDLDTRFNQVKADFINATGLNSTSGQFQFFNSSIIYLSSLSFQASVSDVSTLVQFSGLMIQPPTTGTPSDFRIPGLFKYALGNSGDPVNFTLVGGTNATNLVNIHITAGVPTPNAASATTDTWLNIKNFTALAPVEFTLAIQVASAPINLQATAGNATITLNYSPPANIGGGAITSYKIYRGITSGAESQVSTAGSTTFTDNGLTNGQTYYYKVSAVNAGGEGALSVEISATPSAPLIAISDPPFTLTTNSTITNFTYNSTTGVATFTVSGNLGVGELKIAVPKNLVQSQDNVTITLDGNPITPTITQDTSNYYFDFTYHYTTHTVKVTLAFAAAQSPAAPFDWTPIIAGIIIILIIAGGLFYYMRRRSRVNMPTPTTAVKPKSA